VRLAGALGLLLVIPACSGGGSTAPTAAQTVSSSTPTTMAPEPAPTPPALPRAPGIAVPRAFRAELYASGLRHPTALALGPDGRLYAAEEGGRILRVPRGGRRPTVLARGFETPLGLAWSGRDLLVSARAALFRLRLEGGRLTDRTALVTGLPYGLHQQDSVVVAPADGLFLASGSTCDACVEEDPRSAAILALDGDGKNLRVYATGLRNPYGLALDPRTGDLYASVNGQDNLPDEHAPEPAEMLVRVERGADYGWPRCWPSWLEHRLEGDCDGVTPPVAYLETHSSADGIAFAPSFPGRWGRGVFVALWGQYLSEEHGRRVDFVELPSGRVATFATGFIHPLALATDAEGALLVADWEQGTVVRIAPR
jgi:glucose/arabinose dehydrogenase